MKGVYLKSKVDHVKNEKNHLFESNVLGSGEVEVIDSGTQGHSM